MTRAQCILLGMAYPLVSIAILVITANIDSFALFRSTYGIVCCVALPLAAIAFTLYSAFKKGGGKISHAMLIAWIIAVTFAHMWLIGEISGGV